MQGSSQQAGSVLLGIGLTLAGCTREPATRGWVDAEARGGEASPLPVARLLEAENRRFPAGVTEDDVAHRDPVVRRLAARALARVGHSGALPLLFQALSDEDGDVVAWAAHGLGYLCRNDGVDGAEVVRGLVSRAAALAPLPGASLDPTFAVTRAIGRCATEQAEKTLVAWLSGPRPRAGFAALALGDLASRRKTLAETSQVSLLTAASATDGGSPLGEALYPFGRFDQPAASVAPRLLDVASARLAHAGPERIFAIRALSRAGPGAAPELQRVLSHPEKFPAAERADAAKGLARLGDAGRRALSEALPALVPSRDALGVTALATSSFGPLLAALEALRPSVQRSVTQPLLPERVLYEIANLPILIEEPPTLLRRIVELRCRAAALLVNGGAEDPLLLQCDPEKTGETGQLAQLEVVGRRPIQGRRLSLFRNLLVSKHVRVREAALELLAGHREIEETAAIVSAALGSKEAGVVATAAEFVASHPDRLSAMPQKRPRPSGDSGPPELSPIAPELATQLKQALLRNWAPDDVETIGALLEAAGAARLEEALPELEKNCRHTNPTLREHAARALSLLKKPRPDCVASREADEAAPELGRIVSAPAKLEFVTDSGRLELTLDPSHAPVAVTRIVDLTRQGFYNGIVVHRVVPGYVVQFGDPGGDGFGGPGRSPLRCETTPAPFERFSVGVALAGRDTGSSQLFVTLARYPHLDQEYALLGKADGDWDAVAQGDVIREAKVVP